MKNLALVGCAHIHTPGFIKTIFGRKDVKIKSVWDHDAARAKKNANETGATVVADVGQIATDPSIDGAIVCSETNRHEELVGPLVAGKKNLFVEKPLGFATADGYKMADAIEKAGVKFQTGYFTRGQSQYLFLKEQVEKGRFGKVTRVRASNCHGGALHHWFDTEWRWMADPKIAGVGAFGDLGTHSLDIMLWMFGNVTSVTAQLDVGTNTYAGCDETGEGLLRFKSGVIGTLAAGWDDVANPLRFLISGTEGHAAIVNGDLYFQSNQVAGCDGTHAMRTAELPAGVPAGLDAFLNAVVGMPAVLVSAREAAYRSAVMDAMYQGAKEGTWVTPT